MRTSNGAPQRLIAARNAPHIAAPDGCGNTVAATMNRELSSMAFSIFVFAPADQEHPTDDVELLQLYRDLARPPLVYPFMLLLLSIDDTVAHQSPVHRRARQGLSGDFPLYLMGDSPCSPAPVILKELADQRLDISGDAARAGMLAT